MDRCALQMFLISFLYNSYIHIHTTIKSSTIIIMRLCCLYIAILYIFKNCHLYNSEQILLIDSPNPFLVHTFVVLSHEPTYSRFVCQCRLWVPVSKHDTQSSYIHMYCQDRAFCTCGLRADTCRLKYVRTMQIRAD